MEEIRKKFSLLSANPPVTGKLEELFAEIQSQIHSANHCEIKELITALPPTYKVELDSIRKLHWHSNVSDRTCWLNFVSHFCSV